MHCIIRIGHGVQGIRVSPTSEHGQDGKAGDPVRVAMRLGTGRARMGSVQVEIARRAIV
jgi:hypothetical protein